jgi:hypothetical protein
LRKDTPTPNPARQSHCKINNSSNVAAQYIDMCDMQELQQQKKLNKHQLVLPQSGSQQVKQQQTQEKQSKRRAHVIAPQGLPSG